MKYLFLMCALALPGLASAGQTWRQPLHLAAGGERGQTRISMADAMQRVAGATGGRVLQAQPVNLNGREAYRIKVLTQRGEVRVVHVDAETGAQQ